VDAILLDLELPDTHGWEWLVRLNEHKEFASIPVHYHLRPGFTAGQLRAGTNALELALHAR